MAAVADCFILTFRAVARASRVAWTTIDCTATGVLDRIDRAAQFTGFTLAVHLTVPPGIDPVDARRALARAERDCLVANSLKAPVHLDIDIDTADAMASNAAGSRPVSV